MASQFMLPAASTLSLRGYNAARPPPQCHSREENWMDTRYEHLKRNGYVVLPGVLDEHELQILNDGLDSVFEAEGENAGFEFKQEPGCRRLANLLNKGKEFQSVVAHPRVLPFVRHVLGDVKLSSLNARDSLPQNGVRQPLHADMAAIADDRGFWVCNTLWMMGDITKENGPLRVVPGSHLLGRLPNAELPDPIMDHPDQVEVTGKAGSVVVMNAHLWHGGMENRSGTTRRAIHAFYCRRDKPQQQHQRALLDATVQQSLSPELRSLLALDDPENDRLSSLVKTTSGFMK